MVIFVSVVTVVSLVTAGVKIDRNYRGLPIHTLQDIGEAQYPPSHLNDYKDAVNWSPSLGRGRQLTMRPSE